MPHPPLAVPEVGGGKENAILDTIQAMDDVGAEIAALKPDTIIYITPHGTAYSDYFHVSPGEGAEGNFARFGSNGKIYKTAYNTDVIRAVAVLSKSSSVPAGTDGETDPALDHGIMVPMHYINRHFTDYKAVRVSSSFLSAEAHFKFGQIIKKAIIDSNARAVIVASGDLSHNSGEKGEIFDREIMRILGSADFDALLSMDENLRKSACECGYGAFAILAGCLSDTAGILPRRLSYECPFGVGYGVVGFTIEDAFRSIARRSLEHRVNTGQNLELDVLVQSLQLPKSLLSLRAGAFVSLHINKQLRGCIGTISPSTHCIAEEILQNAVSAGLYDPRFPPVAASELPLLTYKVDILDAPESISGEDELDVKMYGVIVESGAKRGLLLPNLDGIDSVQMQVDIACQKAGISPDEEISLKRFKVTRYE